MCDRRINKMRCIGVYWRAKKKKKNESTAERDDSETVCWKYNFDDIRLDYWMEDYTANAIGTNGLLVYAASRPKCLDKS